MKKASSRRRTPIRNKQTALGDELTQIKKLRLELAKTLHNGVCQTITGARLLAHASFKQIRLNPSAGIEALPELEQLLHKASLELQSLIKSLRSQKASGKGRQ